MESQVHSIEFERETFAFSGLGEVYSFTIVQDPPESFVEHGPYFLALIKLDEGPIVTAQLTDVDSEVAIGDRVEMVTRILSTEGKQGMIVYGYKFRKVLARL